MLRFLKLLSLIFLLLFNVKNIYALDFEKYINNPLKIEYNSSNLDLIQAHIYKVGNTYKGIITTNQLNNSIYKLVQIESVDGVKWKYSKNIYEDSSDVSNARLFSDTNGNFILIFTKLASSDFYKIYWLSCDSDLVCSESPNLLLEPKTTDLNENHGHFSPYILKIDNIYYLFYGAWGNNGFSIRMAFSNHFGDWQKCSNPLMQGADGPFAFLDNNSIYLYFHRSNSSGIQVAKTTLPLNCNSKWENLGYVIEKTKPYDIKHVIFPSLVFENDKKKLYYSGNGQDNVWRLNMAIESEHPSPTLIPTPTSSPSLTPTNTPTPQPQKIPIIIIPGMMSTWNKNAVLHRKLVSQSEWKLASFIKEYNGLTNTLKELDYIENKDYFIFNYDWRKSVTDIAEDLSYYINRNISPKSRFSIIGHSFGGVIARIYQQRFKNDYLKKIITAGSPLRGVPQAYKAISAGEIDQDNSIVWLAQKIILQLYRDQLKTDKQIINENFHSIKDLLPIFDYLRNQNGEILESSKLSIKNDVLLYYEDSLTDLYPISLTLSGNKIETVAGYTVDNRNTLDKLLGYYVDGRPTNRYFDVGDGLVLTRSSSIGNNDINFNYNHGEIIYKKNAIKTILDSLDIPHVDSQIHEGEGTILSPSLILMIKSPAEMEIKIKDKIYVENEGIIFVENALSGEYELLVHGRERGKYEILIGEIGKNNDSWNTIIGEITSIIPQTETHRYMISFNNEEPVDYFVDLNEPTKLVDELVLCLEQRFKINKKMINKLNWLKYYINKKKYGHAAKLIVLIDRNLVKNREYYALGKLENIYNRIMTKSLKKHSLIDKQFDLIKKNFIKKQNKLLKSKNNTSKIIVLELINKKIRIAENNIKKANYSYVEIVLVSISNLLNKL